MALSGAHIACGFVGHHGRDGVVQSLLGRVVWSETMAAAGTTANAAPETTPTLGEPCFEIQTSIDIYVARGKAPDASQTVGSGNTARILVKATDTPRNWFCAPGEHLAWIAA